MDVRYPKELHDLHNDHPFICDKMKINGVEKLVHNLTHKTNLCCSHKALNQAIKQGLILKKVHRVTEFNPVQAGVFWNHIGLGNQTSHDKTLGQNLSKAIKILLTSSPGGKYNVIKPFLVSFQAKIRVPLSFVQ